MKKTIYLLLLGAMFLGVVGFVAIAIKHSIEWISMLLKIIIPTIDPSTINSFWLLFVSLLIILIVGIIVDKILKKSISSLMQQILDKCPAVITEEGYLALKTGERTATNGEVYATCVVPMIHFIPTVLGGLFKIAPRASLKKLAISPIDLITLTMAAGLVELEKFDVEEFEQDKKVESR